MSKWCGTCYRTPYSSCDKTCPIFGLHFEELAKKYFEDTKVKDKAKKITKDDVYIDGSQVTEFGLSK